LHFSMAFFASKYLQLSASSLTHMIVICILLGRKDSKLKHITVFRFVVFLNKFMQMEPNNNNNSLN
ncbi:hypothetical protein ERO13_A05G227866v2, partial [Gossypium hirsutum]